MSQKFFKHFITLNNRKHFYTLRPVDGQSTYVECESAKISQPFLNEDIPALLIDLPNLILAEKEHFDKQNQVIRFRVSLDDKEQIKKKALAGGYKTVSAFLRDLALQA